tara:strand:- start:843 stop:1751 length:909 start_codon:yes stop_codon:yes gene_type:complete
MRIGIIGATSFLAGRLIERFLKDKEIKELILFTSSKNLFHSKNLKVTYFNYHFPKIPLNISDLLNLDLIYFCSALGLEKRDNITDEEIMGINTFEPISLSMKLERKNFSGKFITFGSYFEIGQNDQVFKFKEEEIAFSSRNLFNTYCLSKRMLTNYYSSKLHKINWFHFILPNFYGKGEKPYRLIPYLINSIKNEEIINVTEGKQIRQYLHVKDIVDLLSKLIYKEFMPSIYNLVPDKFYSVKDVTNIIVNSSSKKNIRFKKIIRYDENMKVIIADNSKIKNIFSWEPNISLDFGILNYNKL